jgi:dolichol-phosphate mannosyltransferase
MGENIEISLIIPVYNEEKNIEPFLNRMLPVLQTIGTYEVIFALDPSTDSTEKIIAKAAEKNARVRYMVFSRRIGQPSAVIAGILNCSGKTCAVIDVDLQDPPELLRDMYTKMQDDNYDVVYAQRRSRQGETLLKRIVSYLGYKFINASAEVEIPRNTGDYRIISRRVVEELRRLPEAHGFLRGLVALVGFRQGVVQFDRESRAEGVSKYNRYLGSLKIGLNGLVGFSSFLLSLTLISGVIIALLAFFAALTIIVSKIFFVNDYPVGTPTIIVLVLFMGGVQMISIGILGEYIGRIYDEVKRRPRFIIDRTGNMDEIVDNGDRL